MLKVAHLSDTQIRNFHRHDEFRESYKNLYSSLREEKPDVIVLVGDVAHTKTKISPEFVQLCSDYFSNLANIAPLVVVPGNHDGNLNNLTRLDALTPIVEALGNPRIQYYKKSGVYRLPSALNGNVVVFSCFDEDWPTAEDVAAKTDCINNQVNIGLYHGFVEGAELQNGQIVNDCPYKTREFLKLVDYLMLGDIHKMQILDAEYRAAYCGSYPQQNYGESVTKGYLIWNIESNEKHKVDFVELPNVCPFYTVELEDDLKVPDLDFQKGARIRIKSRQLTVFEKKSLRDQFNHKYEPVRLDILDDVNAHRQDIKIGSVDATIEDIRDVGVQEKLIRGFLEQYSLEDDLVARVLEINRRYNAHAQREDDTLRNVQYRLNKASWDNLFSYGENNELRFTDFPGLVGLFGKSAVGKSSTVVDIPLYCMFNKVSKRVTKNDWLINEKKESCMAEMDILVGKDIHKIKRTTGTYIKSGKKQGKPIIQGVTGVEYNIIHPDGSLTEKTGEDPNDTNATIRKVFGTAEDFIATSVAPQWKLINFIDAGPTERQRLIGRYFDVDIFDKKHALAKEELKDTKANLKVLESKNFDVELADIQERHDNLLELLQENEKTQKHQEDLLDRLMAAAAELQKKLVATKVDPSLTLQKLDSQIQEAKVGCINKKNELDNIELDIKNSQNVIKNFEKQLKKLAELEKERDRLAPLSEGISKDVGELGTVSGTIPRITKKIKDLQMYPCVKNADCCMLEELNSLKSERSQLETREKKILHRIGEKTPYSDALGALEDEINELDKVKHKLWAQESILESSQGKLKAVSAVFDQLVDKVQSLETIKKNWLDDQDQNKSNEIVLGKIKENEFRIGKVTEALKEARESFVSLSKEFGRVEATYLILKTERDDYEALKTDYEAYDYFMRAMSKDGISRKIISDNLGVINTEVQKILSKGVGFNYFLESSPDGRAIDIMFTSEKVPKRYIELCSGMEKTLAAIAIRAALINVTTLPRSNIFVLDEAFGALDPEYMVGLHRILEYLKQLFETVIIITHIEEFKDLVDYVIEVERDEEGFTQLSV